MFEIKMNTLLVSDIANYLGYRYIGRDIEVDKFVSFNDLKNNSLSFIESEQTILSGVECLVLCPNDYNIRDDNITYIKCKNPKLSFYNIVNEFYIDYKEYKIDKNVIISDNAILGVNVNIGSNTFIADNVIIGDNTYIGSNVIIKGNVLIGRNCYIKDGSIIGSEGFDFIEDNNKLVHIPQVGKIIIKDNVWIGSNSVIERATLYQTFINSGVKIDDLVQIGNSCCIESNTQIVAGVVLGAESKIGKQCFIGMNVSVKENITIGDNVTVGASASVINNLESNNIYVGVPAKKNQKREI